MCEFDTARISTIAVQAPTAVPESFVELIYPLPSDVAMVSPLLDHLMRDIEFALREALLNAVIHGNHEDAYKHVLVKLAYSPDGDVSITIQDEAAAFDSGSPDRTGAPDVQSQSRN
jgi:anti-sigma regulatory factor (Ser/Thr protein kinase)